MKELFLKYWNGCYMAICNEFNKNSIFFIYDNQIIRQKKLYRILGKGDFKIANRYYKDIKDDIMFELDADNNMFYVRYNLIWAKFEIDYHLKTEQISEIILDWLKEVNINVKLIGACNSFNIFLNFKDKSKFESLIISNDTYVYTYGEDNKIPPWKFLYFDGQRTRSLYMNDDKKLSVI